MCWHVEHSNVFFLTQHIIYHSLIHLTLLDAGEHYAEQWRKIDLCDFLSGRRGWVEAQIAPYASMQLFDLVVMEILGDLSLVQS